MRSSGNDMAKAAESASSSFCGNRSSRSVLVRHRELSV